MNTRRRKLSVHAEQPVDGVRERSDTYVSGLRKPHYENGLYGFAAQAAWKMTSIPTSCNQYIVEKRRKVPARAEQ